MDNDNQKKTLPTMWLKARSGNTVSLMERLVQRFSVMYPNATSTFFTTPEKTKAWCEAWSDGFEERKFTQDDIKRGLSACLDSGSSFMPSQPEFIELCKVPVVPMCHRSFPILIEQRGTKEGREDGLKKLNLAKDSMKFDK